MSLPNLSDLPSLSPALVLSLLLLFNGLRLGLHRPSSVTTAPRRRHKHVLALPLMSIFTSHRLFCPGASILVNSGWMFRSNNRWPLNASILGWQFSFQYYYLPKMLPKAQNNSVLVATGCTNTILRPKPKYILYRFLLSRGRNMPKIEFFSWNFHVNSTSFCNARSTTA